MLSLPLDVWKRLRWRSVLLLCLVLLNGIFEGGTTLLLLPLLRHIGVGGTDQTDRFTDVFYRGLTAVGLPSVISVILAVVISAFILQYGVFLTQGWLSAKLQHRYTYLWRKTLFEALMFANWRFYVSRKAGELINTLTGEMLRISSAFAIFLQIVVTCFFVVIYLVIATLVSWQVTAGLVAVGIVLVFVARPLMRMGLATGQKISDNSHEFQSISGEFIGGAKLIKATGSEQEAIARFLRVASLLENNGVFATFSPNVLRALFEGVGAISLVAALVAGTQLLDMNSATILVILALFFRLYPRLSGIQQSWQQLNIYIPSLGMAKALLQEATEERERSKQEPESSRPLAHGALSIALEKIVVKYDGKAALSDISIEIPGGTTAAIVGGSGAGKTTLIDTLLWLVEPFSGDVRINHSPIGEYSLGALRRMVGYVGQDTILFNASVRDNLRWGNPNAAEADIVNAAQTANAHDFIMATPQGYDTVVGDRGVRLSGGQKQRLGLARALLGQKALLILDEATSALDSESELEVMKSIEAIRGQITIVIIAHRLSTVRNADYIYMLEGGRMAEQGIWDDLVKQDGKFAHMWRLQSERH